VLPPGSRVRLGCGVTALGVDDARFLIRAALGELPEPTRIVLDIDVSTLDAGHVLPGIRTPPSERGVWYPTIAPYH
jgi:hypothetical protein